MMNPTRSRASLVCLWLLASFAPASGETPGDAVKLGVLTDMSGVYSHTTGKGVVLATQMAVEDCLKVECAGMKIEVLSADHQNKADIAVARAREWIDTQGVDALVDMSNASIQLAMPPLVKAKDRVAIFAGGTSRLSGDACEPEHIVQWMWDTYVQVASIASRLTKPGTTWFLVSADYALGQQFEADTRALVAAKGGSVLGSVRHPFPSVDLSSFLLAAQASGADIIGLANAGGDTLNAIKTAREFGLTGAASKQKLAAYLLTATDVHSLGLAAAQGIVLAEGFYWDIDEGTRAWSKRFQDVQGTIPSAIQAGLYSAVLHYLRSVAAAKSHDARTVIAKMRELPISDDIVRHARLREDGRMVHDFYVFEVKTPAESKAQWDVLKLVETIPADEAFRSLKDSACPAIKH